MPRRVRRWRTGAARRGLRSQAGRVHGRRSGGRRRPRAGRAGRGRPPGTHLYCRRFGHAHRHHPLLQPSHQDQLYLGAHGALGRRLCLDRRAADHPRRQDHGDLPRPHRPLRRHQYPGARPARHDRRRFRRHAGQADLDRRLAHRPPALERALPGADRRAHPGRGQALHRQRRRHRPGLARRRAHPARRAARERLLHARLRQLAAGLGRRASLLALLGDEAPPARPPRHPPRRQGRRGHGAGGRPLCPAARPLAPAGRRTCSKPPPCRPAPQEEAAIRAAYGDLADDVIAEHANFLKLDEAAYDAIKHKILDHWDEIQAIAAQVPPPEQIIAWLKEVGGPATAADLGLTEEEKALAAANGHYLRDRFTMRKLARVLTIAP